MSPSGLVCILIFVKIEDLPSKFNCSVKDEAIDLDDDLEYWIQLALDFNPFAKASKKRVKK